LRYLEQKNGCCLAVNVSDRFGDYGLVGLLLCHATSDRYVVDTFLLSCRVLGRGVEHQILADLGRRALELGKPRVDVIYRPTDKNQPAWDFIKSVGAEFMHKLDDGSVFQFPAARLAGLRYEPNLPPARRESAGEDGATEIKSAPSSRVAANLPGLSEKYQRIASELHTVKQIGMAIEAGRLRAGGFSEVAESGELPATLEGKLLRIWRKAIGNPRIGVNDNFFEAGGTSLKAVQTVAAIRRELQLQLSIVNIFECPTVRLLTEKLEPGQATGGSANEAMERGARRKQRARRRS
jgi:hypothetical protein